MLRRHPNATSLLDQEAATALSLGVRLIGEPTLKHPRKSSSKKYLFDGVLRLGYKCRGDRDSKAGRWGLFERWSPDEERATGAGAALCTRRYARPEQNIMVEAEPEEGEGPIADVRKSLDFLRTTRTG
jgi:hypothetical protein